MGTILPCCTCCSVEACGAQKRGGGRCKLGREAAALVDVHSLRFKWSVMLRMRVRRDRMCSIRRDTTRACIVGQEE